MLLLLCVDYYPPPTAMLILSPSFQLYTLRDDPMSRFLLPILNFGMKTAVSVRPVCGSFDPSVKMNNSSGYC